MEPICEVYVQFSSVCRYVQFDVLQYYQNDICMGISARCRSDVIENSRKTWISTRRRPDISFTTG